MAFLLRSYYIGWFPEIVEINKNKLSEDSDIRRKAYTDYKIVENRYSNLDELNNLLKDGWEVVSALPMGGHNGSENASSMTSLVILEKGHASGLQREVKERLDCEKNKL